MLKETKKQLNNLCEKSKFINSMNFYGGSNLSSFLWSQNDVSLLSAVLFIQIVGIPLATINLIR